MDSGTVTVTVRMAPKLKERLLKIAGKSDTLNAIMIEAAEQFLERARTEQQA